MELVKKENGMNSKAQLKAIKAYKKREKLFLYSWSRLEDYDPGQDAEIRQLLLAIKRIVPEGVDCQPYVERLSFYWRMKINNFLDEIWKAVRLRELSASEKQDYQTKIDQVNGMIDSAKSELKATYFPSAQDWLDSGNWKLYLDALSSYLNDPLQPNEARVIDYFFENCTRQVKIQKILEPEQVEPESILIKPLRKLKGDDLMGHELRSMDIIDSWPAGRIIVAGWNLPIIELEDGQFLTPIDAMLIEFGGCPLGLVYDSQERFNPEGYSSKEKSCKHCWRNFCPGNDGFRAWTLGDLARKLRFAWNHRHGILKVFPQFEIKKLTG